MFSQLENEPDHGFQKIISQGKVNGYVVFRVFLEDYPTAVTYFHNIAGRKFPWHEDNDWFIWKREGDTGSSIIYRLKDAYDMDILTDEDIYSLINSWNY